MKNVIRDLLKRENAVVRVLWFIIIIYPFLFLWQGLNFSDEGNSLTNYRLIFSNPESIKDTFGTWGASVIGGLWLLFFGKFGLVGVRFAGALVSILTIIIAYFILKEYIEKKILLLGILISFLFSYHFLTTIILGYNNLSILFFVAAIFFLVRGLNNNSIASIFTAGFILSFNIFVRLPNVLGLLFIFVISFNAYIKGIRVREHLKQYFVFIIGIFINFAVVYLAMKFLDHGYYYVESIKYLIGATQINHGPYTSQGLVFLTLKGYFSMFGNAALMLSLIIFSIFACLKLDRVSRFIKWFLLPPFLYVLLIKYNLIGIPIGGRMASLLTGISYAILAMSVFSREEDKNLRTIAFLMLTLFVIIPLGSGAGHVNALYLIPIAFPIAINYIHGIRRNDEALGTIKRFVLVAFILYALTNAFAFSYDDSYNRFLLDTKVNSPHLKGIFTTKEKANPLNELLLEMPKYVQRGDTILVAWIAPIIYYLTETKPYFPHPWTEIYSRDQVKNFLEDNQKDRALPVVVRYNYANKHEYDDILYEFFKRNSYEKKWSNRVYEIYAINVY
ncbi:MAG: hypothetical protein AAB866_00240 [Patescibacteria group bacterium]